VKYTDVLIKMDGKSGQKGVSALGFLFSDRFLSDVIIVTEEQQLYVIFIYA
jgi:hypothetical protein